MRLSSYSYRLIWHLFLVSHVPSSRSSDPQGILVNGDLLIGAVIPIHVSQLYKVITFTEKPPQDLCTMFRLENYQQFQALRYAIEEINQGPDLLPNNSLGYYVYDSCAALRSELHGTLCMLTGKEPGIPNYSCKKSPPLVAMIGHSKSTYSILMARILGLYRLPQISYYSTSSLLSDRINFPSFFRTVPSDVFQSRGLAQMLLYFNWTWVGLVASNDDYGYKGIEVIKQELISGGACVAYTLYISKNMMPENTQSTVQFIKKSSAKVLVAFCTDIFLIPLLDEMLKQNVTGKTFVASEAWSISYVLSTSKYSSLLLGTIGFAFHSSDIQGFQEYLNSINPLNTPGINWSKLLWEEVFKCNFTDKMSLIHVENQCNGTENLKSFQTNYNDVSNLRASYNIYRAAYVIAKALDDLTHDLVMHGSSFGGNSLNIVTIKKWKVLHFIKKVQVKLRNGEEIYFDEEGNLPAVYDIVNWQTGLDGIVKHVKVGSYNTLDTSKDVFSINITAIWWPTGNQEIPLSVCSQMCPVGFRKAAKTEEPVCCFECVLCAQGEISNQSNSVDCWKCPWDLWSNSKRDKCFPKSIEYLSYEDPLGIILAATSVFSSIVPISILRLFIHNKSTPIVRANNYSVSCVLLVSLLFCFLCVLAFIGWPQAEKCLLRQATFGLIFALCLSCILAKTILVVFAFNATKPGSRMNSLAIKKLPIIIIIFCTLVQLLLCIFWLSISPPFPQYNIESKPGIIVIECNENSPFAFWCMLGYLGFLSSISFTVAFLARRLPDNFNEAKLITFSMLAFLSVWVYFIPASLSAQGKYTVSMEVFAILTSSWALVICMFIPKCFIILFRPDLNSRQNIQGKFQNSQYSN